MASLLLQISIGTSILSLPDGKQTVVFRIDIDVFSTGPPGTGNSSLIQAIADVSGLDVYWTSLMEPPLTEDFGLCSPSPTPMRGAS